MNMMKTLQDFIERKLDERTRCEEEVSSMTPDHKRQVRLRNAILTLGYAMAVASIVAMPALGVVALTAGLATVLPTIYAGMERHHEAVRIARHIEAVKDNICLIDREIIQAEQDMVQPGKVKGMGQILVPLSPKVEAAASRNKVHEHQLAARQEEKQRARDVDAMMKNLLARKRKHQQRERPFLEDPSPLPS